LPYYDIDNIEQVEDHYRRLLLLFKPWRDESNLKGKFDSYKDSYMEFLGNLSQSAKEDIEKYV
jgi:hypothetical protein